MPTELTPRDLLIDGLVADLRPVQPRRWTRDALLIVALILVEIPLLIALRGMRPDMPAAMGEMAFWWKLAALASFAGLSGAALLVSLDPAVTNGPRLARLWRALAIVVPVALGLGWLIDAATRGPSLTARLDWREGVDCLISIFLLSLPMIAALVVLMRRGAPTRPEQTALAAGLAAAGFGAFIFGFHCSHDDPLYVAVWYGGAVLVVALLSRWLLPRLVRW
ncbi:NrsF family protein [Sandarakinorhabdus sp. DWP1-3-1]|uniref:NrsF family protein n=1 Tax=Sandarakinorhabdus sp. DWP1-3-1 TaxID=2804627 RepID=UPI003CE6CEAB